MPPWYRLTDAKARALKPKAKRYKVGDGGGLCLLVDPSGARYWRLTYRWGGKPKQIHFGRYPEVSLKEARRRAEEARALVRAGRDPKVERARLKVEAVRAAENTFERRAREWLEAKGPGWGASHAAKMARHVERDLLPLLGRQRMDSLRACDLVEALERLRPKGGECVKRARGALEGIFRRALACGHVAADLSGALGELFPVPSGGHLTASNDPRAVGGVLRALEGLGEAGARSPVELASLLLPLVACRPGELVAARWEEIDWGAGEWRFIASKTRAPHFVPLSRQALALLEAARAAGHGAPGAWVFPSEKGGPIVTGSLNKCLRRAGVSPKVLTSHGWRSVFRTLGAEVLGIPEHVLEAQLGHKVPDALGRAYNRTTWREQRRAALQEWADYLDKVKRE